MLGLGIGLLACLCLLCALLYTIGYNKGAGEVEESLANEIEVLISRIDTIEKTARSGQYWINYGRRDYKEAN